jgi:arylsulfatase A-like enzyme
VKRGASKPRRSRNQQFPDYQANRADNCMTRASWKLVHVSMIPDVFGRGLPGTLNTLKMCASIDIFPTLCRLAGAAVPADRVIDGGDIFPLMSSDTARSPHEAIFAMSGPQLHVVRSGRWKLHVRVPAPGFQRLDAPRQRNGPTRADLTASR